MHTILRGTVESKLNSLRDRVEEAVELPNGRGDDLHGVKFQRRGRRAIRHRQLHNLWKQGRITLR